MGVARRAAQLVQGRFIGAYQRVDVVCGGASGVVLCKGGLGGHAPLPRACARREGERGAEVGGAHGAGVGALGATANWFVCKVVAR